MKHKINIFIFSASILVTCLFFSETEHFYLILFILGLLFFIILSAGVIFMKFNYFMKNKNRLNSAKVLLTFDDGPHNSNTDKVLRILKSHEIKAVFFVIGDRLTKNKEIALKIAQEGHIIGNHSQTHNPMMSLFSKRRLNTEINQAQESIFQIIKIKPSIFRPPIGYTNPNYAAVIKKLNMKCIGWSLRSYDSIYKTSDKLISRLVKKTKPGDIVLLHDNLDVTCASLNQYIIKAKSNGIIFASSEDIQNILDD